VARFKIFAEPRVSVISGSDEVEATRRLETSHMSGHDRRAARTVVLFLETACCGKSSRLFKRSDGATSPVSGLQCSVPRTMIPTWTPRGRSQGRGVPEFAPAPLITGRRRPWRQPFPPEKGRPGRSDPRSIVLEGRKPQNLPGPKCHGAGGVNTVLAFIPFDELISLFLPCP
jgi:hypothetical protein